MPEVGQLVQQIMPLYGKNMLSHIGTAKINTPKGSTAYGPGGLYGVQNVGKAYVDFLDKLEIEKNMTPLARHLEFIKNRLAVSINKRYFKMNDEEAERTAHTVSAGSLGAAAILLQSNARPIMKTLENAMVKSGVVSPTLAGRPYRRSISKHNRRVQIFMQHTLNAMLSPTYLRKMGAVNNVEIAQLIANQFTKGTYNRFLSDDSLFNVKGTLSRKGKRALANNVVRYSQVAEKAKALFGGTALEAFQRMDKTFGKDLVETLGAKRTTNLLQTALTNGAAAGYSNENIRDVVSNLAQGFRQEGRDTEDALSVANDFIALKGAGRGLPTIPSTTSEGLVQTAIHINQGPFAKMTAAAYAALSPKIGATNAQRVISKASRYAVDAKGTDTYKNYQQTFLHFINSNLSSSEKLTDETIPVYLNTKGAKRFLQSGMASKFALTHLRNAVVSSRRKLASVFLPTMSNNDKTYLENNNYSDTALQRIHKQKYFTNPIERLKAEQKMKGALTRLANVQGFQQPEQVSNFIQVVSDPDKLKRLQSQVQHRTNIEHSMYSKGKGSLQEAVMEGRATLKGLWKGFNRDSNLTLDDIGKAHDFRPSSKDELNTTLTNWFNPSNVSDSVRKKTSKILQRL